MTHIDVWICTENINNTRHTPTHTYLNNKHNTRMSYSLYIYIYIYINYKYNKMTCFRIYTKYVKNWPDRMSCANFVSILFVLAINSFIHYFFDNAMKDAKLLARLSYKEILNTRQKQESTNRNISNWSCCR